ncbi:MAG: hypothetical protein AVDCRST_MAG68-674, partial [uncultured Gemmatimonadetes bacterium]
GGEASRVGSPRGRAAGGDGTGDRAGAAARCHPPAAGPARRAGAQPAARRVRARAKRAHTGRRARRAGLRASRYAPASIRLQHELRVLPGHHPQLAASRRPVPRRSGRQGGGGVAGQPGSHPQLHAPARPPLPLGHPAGRARGEPVPLQQRSADAGDRRAGARDALPRGPAGHPRRCRLSGRGGHPAAPRNHPDGAPGPGRAHSGL